MATGYGFIISFIYQHFVFCGPTQIGKWLIAPFGDIFGANYCTIHQIKVNISPIRFYVPKDEVIVSLRQVQ